MATAELAGALGMVPPVLKTCLRSNELFFLRTVRCCGGAERPSQYSGPACAGSAWLSVGNATKLFSMLSASTSRARQWCGFECAGMLMRGACR